MSQPQSLATVVVIKSNPTLTSFFLGCFKRWKWRFKSIVVVVEAHFPDAHNFSVASLFTLCCPVIIACFTWNLVVSSLHCESDSKFSSGGQRAFPCKMDEGKKWCETEEMTTTTPPSQEVLKDQTVWLQRTFQNDLFRLLRHIWDTSTYVQTRAHHKLNYAHTRLSFL